MSYDSDKDNTRTRLKRGRDDWILTSEQDSQKLMAIGKQFLDMKAEDWAKPGVVWQVTDAMKAAYDIGFITGQTQAMEERSE